MGNATKIHWGLPQKTPTFFFLLQFITGPTVEFNHPKMWPQILVWLSVGGNHVKIYTTISCSSSSFSLDWSIIMLIFSFQLHAGQISAVIFHASSSPTPESRLVSLGAERLHDIDHSSVGTPQCIKCCCLVGLNWKQNPTNIWSQEHTEHVRFHLPLHSADAVSVYLSITHI